MGYVYQCNFKRGKSIQTAWIPERGAKVGNIVEFKDGGDKDPGWEVTAVGGRMIESDLAEHTKMHRVHRNGSDI